MMRINQISEVILILVEDGMMWDIEVEEVELTDTIGVPRPNQQQQNSGRPRPNLEPALSNPRSNSKSVGFNGTEQQAKKASYSQAVKTSKQVGRIK